MRKTKRWKLEDCYYGGGTKFDRNFVRNFEGNRMSMHALRDRRNWRGTHTWIRTKYTEGLISKYVGRPIEDLEAAYYRRVKDVKNPEPFKNAYSHLICEYSRWGHRVNNKYSIINGIVSINPEYKHRSAYKRPALMPWQFNYNVKHVINPGEIRTHCIGLGTKANTCMTITTPIFIGKLYALFSDGIRLIDVYHYRPSFLDSYSLERDNRLLAKKERFEEEWIPCKIGINSLDAYKEIRNRKWDILQSKLLSEETTVEEKIEAQRLIKFEPMITRKNYGIGYFLNPVCKVSDVIETPTWQK